MLKASAACSLLASSMTTPVFGRSETTKLRNRSGCLFRSHLRPHALARLHPPAHLGPPAHLDQLAHLEPEAVEQFKPKVTADSPFVEHNTNLHILSPPRAEALTLADPGLAEKWSPHNRNSSTYARPFVAFPAPPALVRTVLPICTGMRRQASLLRDGRGARHWPSKGLKICMAGPASHAACLDIAHKFPQGQPPQTIAPRARGRPVHDTSPALSSLNIFKRALLLAAPTGLTVWNPKPRTFPEPSPQHCG